MSANKNAGIVAAYIRVSSKAQDYASQRSSIERGAVARADTIAAWYSEKRTAKDTPGPDREALQKLRVDARAGAIRKLYVFRLDRFTRSGIRDTLEVVEELQKHGVEIVSMTDGFDLNGPAAEVVLAVMAWGAKMELVARNERIAAARLRLEEEGRPWGRPPRMTPELVERARTMQAEGRSVREIAMALKYPRSTVGRALAPSHNAVRDPGPEAP
jgi:DNA invertase Pin-like site-specific DNA recombinase